MTLDAFVQGPQAPSAAMEDKTYTITPVSVKVQAGIVTGEISDIQVVKRVEPRLRGTLRLRNTSESHSVRLVRVKIQYLDDQWQPMRLADVRTDASFAFNTDGSDRLDPGQETVQSVDVACPPQALEVGKLKGLRLALAYVSFPYREEVISFAVSIGSP
ncbi:MAG: hypothetical protein DME15_20030 [Candidatus Rokuibacteriota bacterium]|nr:MAG: hypothetical protein DME15_20030 [Candidatus Rokubacteria bacterium]